MMKRIDHIRHQFTAGRLLRFAVVPLFVLAWIFSLVGCIREPELHLYDAGDAQIELPIVDLALEAYWDYELTYGVTYDWRAEWYYGWDEVDSLIFGPIGYTQPEVFNLRRYYVGSLPYVPHTKVKADMVYGHSFHGSYEWGFWDILVWNDVRTTDGVQSLNFDEVTSLDSVVAYTNMTMHSARYQAPFYTRSFYEPEVLFSAYDMGVEINKDLEGFEYDPERNVYVKRLNMVLRPITYIYLTQVILHNNRNRVIGVDGSGNLSGMARMMNVNTGLAGTSPITVFHNVRFKPNCDKKGENVDIIGGRLLTFGLCDHKANEIKSRDEVHDKENHYIDVTMQFNNGMDSTFVFDVTNQVRRLYKGGVLTIELDVDSIRLPSRKGGSAFDAVVQDYEDGGTHEFEM